MRLIIFKYQDYEGNGWGDAITGESGDVVVYDSMKAIEATFERGEHSLDNVDVVDLGKLEIVAIYRHHYSHATDKFIYKKEEFV